MKGTHSMASHHLIPYSPNPVEAWQKLLCDALASACTFGFACAEQVLVLFTQRAALAPLPGSSLQLALAPAPPDADLLAAAMDLAMGSTNLITATA